MLRYMLQRGHFVVQAENRETEESNGVVGTQHIFFVGVDVKNLMQSPKQARL